MTVSDAGGVYNGSPYAASGSVTGTNGVALGTPTFTYYSLDPTGALTQLNAAPVNVGTYEVVAAFAGNQNYAPASASADFTIAASTSGAPATFEVVDISGQGVWLYEQGTGWRQLTSVDATQVAVDANGDVVAEFAGYGVLRYEAAGGWRQLTPADATQVCHRRQRHRGRRVRRLRRLALRGRRRLAAADPGQRRAGGRGRQRRRGRRVFRLRRLAL